MRSTIGERLLWRDGDFKLSQCAFCAHKTVSMQRPLELVQAASARAPARIVDVAFMIDAYQAITRPLRRREIARAWSGDSSAF